MANKLRQIVEAPSQFFQELEQLVPWLSKFWRTLGQVEEWHEVGSSGEPAFTNSWANVGSHTAAFYKDPWGIVRFKGQVNTGTVGTAAFTLPSTYRPTTTTKITTNANNAFAYAIINTTGTVVLYTSNVTHSLDNIQFRVD